MNELNKRIIFCSSIIALIAAITALSVAPMVNASEVCNQPPALHAGMPMPPPGMLPQPAFGRLPPMLQAQLSDEQDEQLFNVMLSHAKQTHPLERRMAKTLGKLHQLTQQEPFDQSQARKLADSLGATTVELALLQSQFEAQVTVLLSPEQRAALAKDHRQLPPRHQD